MTRLDELYEMRAAIDAEIERERRQLWRMAQLRDDVADLLQGLSTTTAVTLRAVAAAYAVEVTQIIGRDRHHAVVAARHVAAFLLRDQGLSLPKVGRALGRDHTTAMNSCKRVAESVQLGRQADRIRTELTRASRETAAEMERGAA
ncbi:helix-turn-helix domain-containing protein [Nocardioides lianchengensis]|uniref:DnaA protein helix-turn-helix n=1 Tax=Nocardioides lianchengensis TaxID=1045774 RepID=A0A1G6LQJ3_9ACTN|nr:helix-turn-helix domain-containing protein [Nocardioides lianchengensis]NYG12476.1 chromosomal replication initiation ATPase DnaA [Nocardioides lianchengensis]SDC45461.1 dnaA protein helix-turn-helix [Nocardioides lianchengensis]